MKLKGLLKGLCILGLTLLPISFSSADDYNCINFSIPDTKVIYNSTVLSFNNLNFNTQYLGNTLQHLIYLTNYNESLISFYTYYDGKPYIYTSYSQDLYQGIPENVCIQSLSGFNASSFTCNSEPIDLFLNANGFVGGSLCYPSTTNTWLGSAFTYCFYNSNNAYCFKVNSYGSSNQLINLSGSLNLPYKASIGTINAIDWSSSSFTSNSQDTYYYSTGSCPSVGQLKAGSKLTPNVCYAGFDSSDIYGDSSTFTAGQGLSLFDVYNMYSGGMLLQGWYDTYWNYYKNINNNVSMFEGKSKALLGTFFARQTFSDGNVGSYNILNYCYYVVNNIPDSTSTCVGSNVSSQYSGVVITDYDREDILDSIIGRQESVRIQSGFDTGDLTDVYNKSYSLFSSRTINPGFNGILPPYIIIGFLGIVLLYFLRR